MLLEKINGCLEGDLCRLIHGKAVRARAEGRQGNAATAVLDGQFQRTAIGAGQQGIFAAIPVAPNGSDGMDDEFCGEFSCRGDDSGTGGATVGIVRVGFVYDGAPPAAVDRSLPRPPAPFFRGLRIR